MADASDSRRSPAVKDHNNEVTLYRDNQPLLKVECGISLGLLKLIYSSDASYDGILLGVKPRLLTESVPCVITFDSTQLTYPEYDLIVQAAPAAVHLQKAVSRDEEISAGAKKSFISRARDIACYNRNYPEESSHSLAHSARAQIQHEEIAEKCITPGSSSSNNQTDASQDVQLSLRSICISAIQSAGSNVAQFTRGHHLPSQQVVSSSENFTYMDCDTNELPDSTVQEFEVEVLDVSTETDKTREIAEQDFEAPEGIQFNPEEFNFDIGSVIPFQSVKGTRWPCDRCGKDFCSSSHLKRHWILHTDFKPYKCKVCSKCFAFHWDLKKHSTKHTGNKPFKCSFCPKSFNSQVERKNHNWLHTGKKEYKCQLCHHEFISLSNLNAHMRKHTGEKPYKCEYCPKSFHILGHYQYHMRRHTGEKPYKCEICGKAFSYSNNLTEHRNVHTGERPYSCSQCNKRFTHRSTFKQHMLMHEGNKPYKCHVCSKAFVQSSNYQRHIETHKKKEDRVQKCDLCGKELLSRRGVQKHRLRCVKKTVERANAHLRVLRTSRLRRGEYRCELCPRIFSYSRRLETHVASKHPPSQEDSTMKPSVESTFDPFAAENAGSGNDVSSGKGSRSKRGEFRCEHCPKIFVYSRRLQSHVRKYHSSSTNDSTDNAKIHPPSPLRFQCSACGRWFDHTKRLREHQIKNHRRGLLQETASTAVPHAGVPLLPKSSDSDKNVLREETRHPLEAVPRVIQTDISPANSQAATGERTKNYLHPDDKDKREAGKTGFESLSALSRLFAQIGMEGNYTSSQSIVESGQISQQ